MMNPVYSSGKHTPVREGKGSITPGRLVIQVFPPSVDCCHWQVGAGLPEAGAVKLAPPPAVTIWVDGCVVMAGGDLMWKGAKSSDARLWDPITHKAGMIATLDARSFPTDESVMGWDGEQAVRGADGTIAWSAGEQNIREAIQIILQTEEKERLNLPTFGAGLQKFLFEPNTVTTQTQITDRITKALQLWEPRISLIDVEVDQDPNAAQAAIATIQYCISMADPSGLPPPTVVK